MKNFLYKQREVVTLLIYAAVVAGLIYLVILPIIARINGMNDQIQQESMQQESVKLHIAELPGIQKQYQALQGSGDLANALLDKNKAVILIEKLEKLAESTNNKITIAVRDNAPVKKTPTKGAAATIDELVTGLPSQDYLQLKITLVGDYNSVVKFVALLEKFEYYADITAFQINKEESSVASVQPASNAGIFDAGNLPATSGIITDSKASTGNTLTASLDTVFYTN